MRGKIESKVEEGGRKGGGKSHPCSFQAVKGPRQSFMFQESLYCTSHANPLSGSKINRMFLPDPFTVVEAQSGERGHEQIQKCKHGEAPSVAGGHEELRRHEGQRAADHGAKQGPRGDGRRGVFGEGVDVVVLDRVEGRELAEGEEGGADDGHEPVRVGLDRPGKAEQGQGDEDGADVGERETELGFGGVVVARGERVEDGVDPRDDEDDCRQEADSRAKVHQTDLGGGETVPTGTVDDFKVGVKAVVGAEQKRLVDGHD